MRRFLRRVRDFLVREDGPTSVEYSVLLSLIVVGSIAAVQSLGTATFSTYETAALSFANTKIGKMVLNLKSLGAPAAAVASIVDHLTSGAGHLKLADAAGTASDRMNALNDAVYELELASDEELSLANSGVDMKTTQSDLADLGLEIVQGMRDDAVTAGGDATNIAQADSEIQAAISRIAAGDYETGFDNLKDAANQLTQSVP